MEFDITLDTEPPNRGWVVDKISVTHDLEEIAYLKCSYIPKQNIEKFYPLGVITYLDKISGWCGAETRYQRNDVEQWMHINHSRKFTCEEVLAIVTESHGQEFKDFQNYFVDKPFEDYISVEPDYRRQGIAEKMLLFAADYYQQKGMEFYLSNLRTDPSEGLKTKMVSKYQLPSKRFRWLTKCQRHYFPLSFSVHQVA